jgi:hypothetical protein
MSTSYYKYCNFQIENRAGMRGPHLQDAGNAGGVAAPAVRQHRAGNGEAAGG